MNQIQSVLKMPSKSSLHLQNFLKNRICHLGFTTIHVNRVCRRNCSNQATEINLYEILKVEKTASDEEIKSSFYRLSKLYHPDVNSTKEAKKLWQDLNEAYNILGNERTRKLYDNGLLRPGGEFNIPRHGPRVYPAYERQVHPMAKKKKYSAATDFDRKQLDQYNYQFMKDEFARVVFDAEKEHRRFFLEKQKAEKTNYGNFLFILFVAAVLIGVQVVYYQNYDDKAKSKRKPQTQPSNKKKDTDIVKTQNKMTDSKLVPKSNKDSKLATKTVV